MTDKEKIRKEVQRLINELIQEKEKGYGSDVDDASILELQNVLTYIDSLQEEPVSEELEIAARDTLDTYKPVFSSSTSEGEPIEYYSPGQMRTMFMEGSHWQKERYLKELTNSDLETAADKYAIKIYNMFIKDETTLNNKEGDEILSDAFKAGAKWKKKHLWKPADGDDLPEIDKEVIVLYQRYPLENNEYAVGFAHRPNPDGWDGKNLLTDEIEHYTPETYDKGGWNIPDVMFWLDCNLPKKNN